MAPRTGAAVVTRRHRLEQLLRRYPDTLPALTVNGHGDGAAPLMPRVWHDPNVQELERCLDRLRAGYPRVHSHVVARYVNTGRVALTVRLRDGRYVGLPDRCEVIVGAYHVDLDVHRRRVLPQQRTPGDPTERVLVATWPRWVDTRSSPPGAVELGLRVLEREFRGEPMLPHEFVCSDRGCDRCSRAA